APALSQENLRFLSCHGQINRKSGPLHWKAFFPAPASKSIASGRRDPDGSSDVPSAVGGGGQRGFVNSGECALPLSSRPLGGFGAKRALSSQPASLSATAKHALRTSSAKARPSLALAMTIPPTHNAAIDRAIVRSGCCSAREPL